MTDLIDRQASIHEIHKQVWLAETAKTFLTEALNELPSVEAEPVRHGHWEINEGWDGDEYYQCSECGAEFVLIDGSPEDNDYQYCPHCGARNV